MTAYKIRYFIGIALYTIVCALLVLMQSSGLLVLKIYTASAFLTLPLVLYAGYYFGEFGGAVIGLFLGAATDVYSSTFCYNTVMLTVLGFAAGMLMSYFFNRNIAAAVVINACASVLYFFLKWLTVYAFSDPAAGFVLTRFSLPSAVFTASVGIVMFFVVNPILKRIPIKPTKR